jgi:hypothetical protein
MGSKFDFRMSRSDYDDLCFDLTDDEHAVGFAAARLAQCRYCGCNALQRAHR